MKRKASEDFDDGGHYAKVRRLLQHRPGTIETPEWHQQLQTTRPSDADVDLRNVIDNFVQLYERLDTMDDINIKPNYSYTELVYLAILRSPNFCLPITEIYRYIQHRFMFFRHSTRQHWRNAVRHSLSKTKCFSKISAGRSCGQVNSRSTFLWTIVPSSVVSFVRGDYRSSVDRESGINTLRMGYFKVNAGQFWDRVTCALLQKQELFKQWISLSDNPKVIFKTQVCTLPSVTSSEASTESSCIYSPVPQNGHVHSFSNECTTEQSSAHNYSPVVPNSFDFTRVPFYNSPTARNVLSNCSYTNINVSSDSGNETMVESSPESISFTTSTGSHTPDLHSSYLSDRGSSPGSASFTTSEPTHEFNHLIQHDSSAIKSIPTHYSYYPTYPRSATGCDYDYVAYQPNCYQDTRAYYPSTLSSGGVYSRLFPPFHPSAPFSNTTYSCA